MDYCVWGVYSCSKLAPELNMYLLRISQVGNTVVRSVKEAVETKRFRKDVGKWGGAEAPKVVYIPEDPNVITIDFSCLCVFVCFLLHYLPRTLPLVLHCD